MISYSFLLVFVLQLRRYQNRCHAFAFVAKRLHLLLLHQIGDAIAFHVAVELLQIGVARQGHQLGRHVVTHFLRVAFDRLAAVLHLVEGYRVAERFNIGLILISARAGDHHLVGANIDGALFDHHVVGEGADVALHVQRLFERVDADRLAGVGFQRQSGALAAKTKLPSNRLRSWFWF